MRKIKGVLFDFDGTLTSPGALDFPALKHEMNCPDGTPILEYLETLHPGRRAELFLILERKEEEAARNSYPNKAAETCLTALKKRGIPLGIITRNSRKSVLSALNNFKGISINDFVALMTRENSLPKPHPDGIYQAARQMGIAAADLLFVGDFRFDIMAGKAAGCPTALLTNGEETTRLSEDPRPDYTLTSLDEILRLVS
jgi:HAD superfamily hydrolase (TIGR01509 family)